MRSLIIAAVVIGSVTAASAADMQLKAPPKAPPPPNWTALYIGGYAGGTWVDGTFGTVAAPGHFNSSGFVGGVYAGYDYELANKFVVGGRLAMPLAAVTPTLIIPFGIPAGEFVKPKMQWGGSANVTLGYDMGMWMPFVGVGAIFVGNKVTLTEPGVGSGDDTEVHTGLNLMAGAKYALSRNWAVGFQYNHSSFDKKTYTWPGALNGMGIAKFDQNSAVVTAEYRF